MSSIGALDVEAVRAEFLATNELVHLEAALDADEVAALLGEIEALRSRAHRSYVPGYKKSGSLSYYQLERGAPTVLQLYRSRRMRELVEGLAGKPLHLSPDNDPQTCAVYIYDREGDGMGQHVDSCFYCDAVYVVLIGLVNRSTSVLRCEPTDGRVIDVATEPGSMTIFNGHNIRHGVTRLGPGEERIILALQYLEQPRMAALTRLRSNLSYAWEYFGPAVLVPRPAHRLARSVLERLRRSR